MKIKALLLVATMILVVPSAFAVEDTATLTLTGTVDSSMQLAVSLGAATSTLGTVSKFDGTVPTGWTRTPGATSWTLTAPVGITVDAANLTTGLTYDVTAELTDNEASGVSFKFNTVSFSDTAPVEVVTDDGLDGDFDGSGSFDLEITVADSAVDGVTVANTITFTAIAD